MYVAFQIVEERLFDIRQETKKWGGQEPRLR